MKQSTFMSFAALVACTIGSIALLSPTTLLVNMKTAVPSDSAIVMARTAGVFLTSFGLLNFLVRNDPPSPTLRKVFLANAVLQALILPVDPFAYFTGIYVSPASFVPNTILHVILLGGFIYYWRAMSPERRAKPLDYL